LTYATISATAELFVLNCHLKDVTTVFEASFNLPCYVSLTVKRGRGRPRRRPLSPEELSSVMVFDGGNAVPLLVLFV